MMTALMTEQNAMEVMWNRQKVTPRVQKLRRMIIAALEATGRYFHWKGQEEVGQGKTFHTHIRCTWQNILTKLPGIRPSKESHHTLPSMELAHCRCNF
jgi:hypothetical protein